MPVTHVDDYSSFRDDPTTPAENIVAVTPSDTDELAHASRGVMFSAAGALAVVTVGGQTITLPSGLLVAGVIHPIRVKQILSTGTTATNIHYVY